MRTLFSIHIMRNYGVFLDLWLEVGHVLSRRETNEATLTRLSKGLSEVAVGVEPLDLFDFDAAVPVALDAGLFNSVQQFATYLAMLGHADLTEFLEEFLAPLPTWAMELEVHAAFRDSFDNYCKGLDDGDQRLLTHSLDAMVKQSHAGITPDLDAPMEDLLENEVVVALFTKEEQELFNSSLLELWMILPDEASPYENGELSDSTKLSKLGRDNGYWAGLTLNEVSNIELQP